MKKLSVTQLSEKMGIARPTLLDKINRGTLPDGMKCRKVGKTYVISVPDGMDIQKSEKAEYIRNRKN